jgi:MoxR-like ATPase
MIAPQLATLLERYQKSPELKGYADRNFQAWRAIVGGHLLARAPTHHIDPRAEYWHIPARRFLVAYFSTRFHGKCAPLKPFRRLAFGVFRDFDHARAQGRLDAHMEADLQNQQWDALCGPLREVSQGLQLHESDFAAVKAVWGAKALGGETLRESLESFLDATAESGIAHFELPLWKRLCWFPYLALTDLDPLASRQRFFGNFYNLFASTNAYRHAGSQTFAPILQNTPTKTLLEYADRWAKGELPKETGFLVLGRGENQPKECAHHNTVLELFGFLNLARGPIYNTAAQGYYQAFAKPGDDDPLLSVLRFGETTTAFAKNHPAQVEALVAEVRKLQKTSPREYTLNMERITSRRVEKLFESEAAQRADTLLSEVHMKTFDSWIAQQGDLDTATAMLNLLVDAHHYIGDETPTATSTASAPSRPATAPPPAAGPARRIDLPPSLRPVAEQALRLLRGGFHVLLAGAPGTGKTTLGQVVAHAWNHGLAEPANHLPMAEAPRTVVAHSAWATFHTVGGMLPQPDSSFRVTPGIFVRETDAPGIWALSDECFVLDEMNRADLDRCIGDLYPLLSRTVEAVCPAGLPGVASIRDDPRFRVVATVNDATLDDIVFPISEGLARRFLRIELLGATLEDATAFLGTGDPKAERVTAATLALEQLFDEAREAKKLKETEAGEHLPFGVGYFAPLRAWVGGNLTMTMEADPLAEAVSVLLLCLRGMARVRSFAPVLEKMGK